MKFRRFFVFLCLVCLTASLFADTAAATTANSTASTTPVATPYTPSEFPQWQKDLRRAEILSFGALPFVTFFASIYYDVYRYYSHDQEEGYLPWPFKKSSTAVALSEDEQKKILVYSAGISVSVALFDFGYRKLMREIRMRKAERANDESLNPIQIEPVDTEIFPGRWSGKLMGSIHLVVTSDAGSGMRLDRYCALMDGSVSRSRLKNGALSIMVNGKLAKMSKLVREKDIITIDWEDPPAELPVAENIPLDILYEDSLVTVVNKKQGMVTHPGAGNWSGTLVHALLWHWHELAPEGNLRPGIVHRLDKDTSGIIITARKPEAETWLQGEFSGRRVIKVYLAILHGVPKAPSGDIRTQIVRDPKNRKRFTWSDDPEKGRFAHTAYRVLASYGNYSIVRFRLYTGRTHQIRVHSKYLGCPILGDPVYGKKDPLFPGATLMLHARFLRIRLPGSSVLSLFAAPVPIRFRKVLATLKEKFPK